MMPSFSKSLYDRYEALSLTRLSKNFILRDFMFSVEAAVAGHSNYPSDNTDRVIESGKFLCSKVLEPILEHFGRFAITFGYQGRETMERTWSEQERLEKKHSSTPHHWDRGTFGDGVYARVDIMPFCVEDGLVTKREFGHWVMQNLDIDLLMQWQKANIYCITISPQPRRVWVEWTPMGKGDNGSNKIEIMGRAYWEKQFPLLPPSERPAFHPSATNGRMTWHAHSKTQ